VPKDSGLAFVIVQHLDPTRQGIMPELLQRTTGMKVVQVKDRTTKAGWRRGDTKRRSQKYQGW
jgi:chemotaxis response regulator CheB